jgi:N-acetylglucosamine malate deacetylase 1
MPNVDVMAFGAHPDDIEICVGGTLIKLVELGHSIVMVDMVRGEMGTRGTPEMRAQEAAAAAAVIGATARENLGLPDGGVHLNDDSRRRVAEVVRQYRPRLAIAPFPEGRHPDHYHTGEIAYEGIFMAGLAKFDTGQEAWRPSRLLYYPTAVPFTPSFVVDVTAQVERKMEAIYCYASQFDPNLGYAPTRLTTPEFRQRLLNRSAYFGSLIDKDYGEAFQLRGMLEVDNPLSLSFASY